MLSQRHPQGSHCNQTSVKNLENCCKLRGVVNLYFFDSAPIKPVRRFSFIIAKSISISNIVLYSLTIVSRSYSETTAKTISSVYSLCHTKFHTLHVFVIIGVHTYHIIFISTRQYYRESSFILTSSYTRYMWSVYSCLANLSMSNSKIVCSMLCRNIQFNFFFNSFASTLILRLCKKKFY